MNRAYPRLRRACLALAGALLACSTASAQADLHVTGRVVGPDGTPLAGQSVVLHRVDAAGGATIADATSGDDGRFELNAPGVADSSAVFFIAARYEGELYIAPPFRAGESSMAEQLVRVGVPELSATTLMGSAAPGPPMPPAGRPATPRSWLLLAVPLLGVAAVALYALVRRRGVPPERALLIRLAELDEAIDAAPAAERAGMESERARLADQVRVG